MPRVEIDSESFEAVSAVFGQRISAQVTNALSGLVGHLSGTGAMAGSDEAGMTWAASYDKAAELASTAGTGSAYYTTEAYVAIAPQRSPEVGDAVRVSRRTGDQWAFGYRNMAEDLASKQN